MNDQPQNIHDWLNEPPRNEYDTEPLEPVSIPMGVPALSREMISVLRAIGWWVESWHSPARLNWRADIHANMLMGYGLAEQFDDGWLLTKAGDKALEFYGMEADDAD